MILVWRLTLLMHQMQFLKVKLKKTVRSYIHKNGTLANVHFLSIPYNSSKKDAAQVFINFLISPKAQLKKQNKDIWGDPSVLSVNKLQLRMEK